MQWDPDIQYKSILILEGGYENYILMYPMDCTNPNVRPPSTIGTEAQNDGQLDDIEYPSLSDITMKEQSFGFGGGSNKENQGLVQPSSTRPGVPPKIDRSSKLAALKSYNSRQDLLREQHDIAERLLASQRECLNEELQLDERIKEEVTLVVDEKDVNEEDDKINESRFRIMQLDNSIEDTMLKKQLVDETKAAVVPEKDQQEAQDNKRILASIRQKEAEILEIAAKRERIAREREEKLRLAKEQKKNLLNRNNNSHNIYKPAIHVPSHPVVDRSVKPLTPAAIADFDDNIRRDFAPVHGQVVSLVIVGTRGGKRVCH